MTERELVERGLLEDDVRACEQHCAELERELAEARAQPDSWLEDRVVDLENQLEAERDRRVAAERERDQLFVQLMASVPAAELRKLLQRWQADVRTPTSIQLDMWEVITAAEEREAAATRETGDGGRAVNCPHCQADSWAHAGRDANRLRCSVCGLAGPRDVLEALAARLASSVPVAELRALYTAHVVPGQEGQSPRMTTGGRLELLHIITSAEKAYEELTKGERNG